MSIYGGVVSIYGQSLDVFRSAGFTVVLEGYLYGTASEVDGTKGVVGVEGTF